YGRNGQSRRFAERNLTQQLNREWSTRHRPIHRWLDDRRRRRGDVLFPERPQLYRRNCGFDDDASADFRAENRDRFSRRARVGGNLVFDKTSACAHDFAAIFSGRRFPLALVVLFAAGFGMLLFFSTSNTVLQTIVPDEMRGRVMGVWSLVFGAMIPLGSLEAGAVAHFVGTPLALAFGAVICAASALV